MVESRITTRSTDGRTGSSDLEYRCVRVAPAMEALIMIIEASTEGNKKPSSRMIS